MFNILVLKVCENPQYTQIFKMLNFLLNFLLNVLNVKGPLKNPKIKGKWGYGPYRGKQFKVDILQQQSRSSTTSHLQPGLLFEFFHANTLDE